MALINCRECGKEISSLAKFCPNCGCPTVLKKGRGFAIASLVLGIISCVYSLSVLGSAFSNTMEKFEVIGMAIYIMLFAILALIFGLVSHIKGSKLVKKTAGIVMGIISIVVLSICIIIAVL